MGHTWGLARSLLQGGQGQGHHGVPLQEAHLGSGVSNQTTVKVDLRLGFVALGFRQFLPNIILNLISHSLYKKELTIVITHILQSSCNLIYFQI